MKSDVLLFRKDGGMECDQELEKTFWYFQIFDVKKNFFVFCLVIGFIRTAKFFLPSNIDMIV